uniref:C2H2-type domain-containing protein n=1 Tax=Scylla olivacea TaxID=85551 RepID=A0A0P4WGY8_SCYOL
MTSSDEWEENLGNIDDLISSNLSTLETEDVIYLEEYLVGDFDSHSPSLWSALKEDSEGDASPCPNTRQEGIHTDQSSNHTNEENSENVDDPQVPQEITRSIDTAGNSLGSRQRRANRGVPKPKFVSYQAFPPLTKDKPFQCELCGQRLATRESRKRHIIAKHVKEKNNVCSDCGKKFVFKFSLKAHAAIHSATPNFTCVCGQTFSVRGSYMNHVRRVHRAVSEVKYSCELCFKSFVDHHTLRLHLISVHKPKTIACLHSGCNKVFSTGALMKSHYWYHLKQRFPCDECGQTFSTESYMYKHRRTHSGIRPYMCVDCGKTYLSVSHLNKHRRAAHSTYRPFQCSFCGKCYKTKDQLTFHESSHRGEKPFQCEVCGYATAYRNTYYAHRKKHQTSSLTSTAQKKNKGDIPSTTDHIASGDENNTIGKKGEKNKTKKKKSSSSPSKYKSSPGVSSSKTSLLKNATTPILLNTTSGSVKGASCSMSVSPSTASVNVICVVSSEPNDTSVLPECSRNLSTNFPLPVDNHRKNVQSSASTNFMSSEPLNLVHPPDRSTEMTCLGLHQTTKPDTYELVTNHDVTEENSKKSSEEQTSCIILSNAAKCSFPMCESSDESLLLFKVDDESYVALCPHHSLTDLADDAVKEGTSLKGITYVNISTQVLDNFSQQNETTEQETSDSVDLKVVTTEANISESIPHSQSSPELCGKHTPSDSSLVQLMSQSASTTPEICITNMPVSQQLDCVKPSTEVCLTEHLSTIMELDSGIVSPSGPIVDESFSLAEMEVHCLLCEEQFLCMDDYVTHLESCNS